MYFPGHLHMEAMSMVFDGEGVFPWQFVLAVTKYLLMCVWGGGGGG